MSDIMQCIKTSREKKGNQNPVSSETQCLQTEPENNQGFTGLKS